MDVDGEGYVEVNEFAEFMRGKNHVQQHQEKQQRRRSIANSGPARGKKEGGGGGGRTAARAAAGGGGGAGAGAGAGESAARKRGRDVYAKLFPWFDADGNGALDLDELRDLVRSQLLLPEVRRRSCEWGGVARAVPRARSSLSSLARARAVGREAKRLSF